MSFGDQIVAAALAAEGMNATTDPVGFGNWMGGPGEDPARSLAMATGRMANGESISTCGLVRRRIQADAGDTDPRLFAPYHTSMAIEELLAIASERGALISFPTWSSGVFVECGDMIGLNLDQGNGHVATVIAFDPVSRTMTTIDGGVVDEHGDQSVHRRARQWVQGPGDTIIDVPSGSISRRVTHIARARLLDRGFSSSSSAVGSLLVFGIVGGAAWWWLRSRGLV